jgi:hypothetical protein
VTGDAARWRELVALARGVFDDGDAWADRHDQDADTAPMRRACRRGRLALERGDVAGIARALVDAGRAERTARSTALAVAAIRRARQRRRGRTKQATFRARDAEMIEHLKAAPPSALKSNRQAARWLIDNHPVEKRGGDMLGERQLIERLKKCGAIARIS